MSKFASSTDRMHLQGLGRIYGTNEWMDEGAAERTSDFSIPTAWFKVCTEGKWVGEWMSEGEGGDMKKRVNSETRIGSLLWPAPCDHRWMWEMTGIGILSWDRCWEPARERSEWQMVLKLFFMEKKKKN